MQLWLVRHPRVLLAPGICYGASDVPADPAHTSASAARLARTLPRTAAAWCSPLARCRSLAEALQAQQPGWRFAIDARLAEMDFGHWEGRAWSAIGPSALAAWTRDFAAHRPGDAESVAQFLARVQQALRSTASHGADAAVWITHAGVVKAVQWLLTEGGAMPRADQWPAPSLACGDCCVLELAPTATCG